MESKIIDREATDIAREYYTDYSRYVLETRALPSVMDGLKLVQRRIIYTAGTYPDKLTKTANLAGSVMKVHPHGDSSGAIVTLANPTTNLPIFDIKGNFGGYGYGAASSRYTECKLSKIGRFIYTQFIDYAPMIQGELGIPEPEYLPTMLPYALVEGCNGIGVGLSTNIVPLNIMDLIDYYMYYIENNKFNSTKVIRPEFRSMIVHLSDEDAIDAAQNYKGWYDLTSVIKQESDNIYVVEALYGKSIDKVLSQLSWWIDSGKVDFRNESKKSERYVFEIEDQSIDREEFVRYLTKATRKRQTFTRVMVDRDCAVYCNLNYVVKKSLEGLNKAIDNMIESYTNRYTKQLALYDALTILKNSDMINKITQVSTDDIIEYLVSNDVDPDIASEVVKRPISYLTRSHDSEYDSIKSKLDEVKSHDRKKYLLDLYKELKEMLKDFYDSRSHSVLESQVLDNPTIKLSDPHTMIISDDPNEEKYDHYVYLISDKGNLYKRLISSNYSCSIDTNTDDNIVGIVTDKYEYMLVKTYDDTYGLIIKLSDIKYDKKVINMFDDEVISSVIGLIDIDADQASLVKSRVSRTVKL